MFDIGENEGFELIEVGEYEAYVSEVTPPSNINGKMVSNLSYTIRGDVEGQSFAGRTIKFDYFSDAENMKWKISSLAKALGFFENEATSKVVNGVKKLAFNSFEEFINACLNKPLRISVKQELYTNNKGEEKSKNSVDKYMLTNCPDFTAPLAEAQSALEGTDDGSQEELPF